MKLAVRKCLACTGGGLGGLLAGHVGYLAATIAAGAAASAMPLWRAGSGRTRLS